MLVQLLNLVCRVREQHPLKQGLRPRLKLLQVHWQWGQRATSIKTRIETSASPLAVGFSVTVREQHPLKQGLRPGMPGCLN